VCPASFTAVVDLCPKPDSGIRFSGFSFRVLGREFAVERLRLRESGALQVSHKQLQSPFHTKKRKGDSDSHQVSWFRVWEGCRESRRCSRNTYPESYITQYTSIRR